MATLDEFIETQGNIEEEISDADSGTVLPVIFLGASGEEVRFGHLGIVFTAKRSDIIAVDSAAIAIPNSFGKGTPCNLVFLKGAEISRRLTFKVERLLENQPFVIARPSLIPATDLGPEAEAEAQWLEQRGLSYPNDAEINTTTYTGTSSSQNTYTRSSSYSRGIADDTYVDDSNSDSMGRDDADPDDIKSTDFSLTTTYTGTTSSQITHSRCSSFSGGQADDNRVDDSNSDSMGRDDSHVDDA